MPAETSAAITSACSVPAFELHGLAARLLENAAGVFDGPVGAQVVAGKRHVDDHQRVLHGAADHFGVVDHLVERDRQRVGVSLHDHRHAVADQDALDAGGVEQAGHGVVVGRQHRDLLAGGLHGPKFGDRDLAGVAGHGSRCLGGTGRDVWRQLTNRKGHRQAATGNADSGCLAALLPSARRGGNGRGRAFGGRSPANSHFQAVVTGYPRH